MTHKIRKLRTVDFFDPEDLKWANDLLATENEKKFASLVKRMRAAQDAFNQAVTNDVIEEIDLCHIRMLDLERKVDEWIKNMEQ